MSNGKVLVLGSNATRIVVQGGGAGPTGNYLNETVVPAMALIEAGHEVVLATPNGTKPHIDEASDSAAHFGGDQAAYSRAKAFWADDPTINQVRTLRSVIESPAYPRSMHICFYIRDDVDFNKFIHDLEAESARRGMTQVKANRVITVTTEKDRLAAPMEANTNRITQGKSNGWSSSTARVPKASNWNR